MHNINDHHKGRTIMTLATRHRRLSADFPGWDAPDRERHLLDTPHGLRGQVVSVESHGSNPWTRYTIKFEDGSRGTGFCHGVDFVWA